MHKGGERFRHNSATFEVICKKVRQDIERIKLTAVKQSWEMLCTAHTIFFAKLQREKYFKIQVFEYHKLTHARLCSNVILYVIVIVRFVEGVSGGWRGIRRIL